MIGQVRDAALSRRVFLLVALGAFLFGCESEAKSARVEAIQGAEAAGGAPLVVATTTMIASAARAIGGDAFRVEGIVGPGGDPHLYRPRPSDAALVAKSDLVLVSGLGLEGWLDGLVRNAGGERPVVVVSEGVDPLRMEGSIGGVDPHFWFDLEEWSRASNTIARALSDLAGPEERAAIEARREAYLARLETLAGWTRESMATIPAPHRALVTSHDAFNYFGRAWGIEVVGIQGISTEGEASTRDVVRVVELVRRRKVPAIFVESSVNPGLIKQVARETGVRVAGPLYADATGPTGSGAETFIGMYGANVEAIVRALGGTLGPRPPELESDRG